MTTPRYMILKSEALGGLAALVNESLAEGWVLTGGPVQSRERDTDFWIQGMFRSLKDQDEHPVEWPSPTAEMMETKEFKAILNCISRWDIWVPGSSVAYEEATGKHVRAIMDALAEVDRKDNQT